MALPACKFTVKAPHEFIKTGPKLTKKLDFLVFFFCFFFKDACQLFARELSDGYAIGLFNRVSAFFTSFPFFS